MLLNNWGDLPCFAHTLQLAVNAGLSLAMLKRLSGMCRKIVGHFKHSAVAMGALRERQKSMNIPQHCLIQDVTTRSNSTYFMYERLAEQRWAIYAVIHDEQVTSSKYRYLDLNSDQWDLLSQMAVVLKPLQIATTALCKEQNIDTPVVNGLLKCHLKNDDKDLVALKRFKETVSDELQRRFSVSPESVAVIAAAVDPRYHQLTFLSIEKKREVHHVLQDKVETLYKELDTESEETDSSAVPQAKRRKQSNDSGMSFLLGATTSTQDKHPSWKDEFVLFVRVPQLHHDEDALVWWRVNEPRFPTIAKIAKSYLCCPATSVPSERIFSTAGNVITNKRCSLTPDNADMLIFLNKNL